MADANLELELAMTMKKPMAGGEHQAWVVEVEGPKAVADFEDETKFANQEMQSSERPSKINQEPSCWRACGWLIPLIRQVVYGKSSRVNQLIQQKKSLSNYSGKALWFAITMLSAYLNQFAPTSVTVADELFLIVIGVFVIIDAVLALLLPDWGNALVCISWLLLELASCLLILSFSGYYSFAILAVLFLIIVVAIFQRRFLHDAAKKYMLPLYNDDRDAGSGQQDTGDEENQHLGHLFDLSQGTVNCGGLVAVILGHYMLAVPINAVGFFFFGTIALGLYLMMVITVRAVSLPHATCLATVLMVLLVLTVITASTSFVRHSVSNAQVVK